MIKPSIGRVVWFYPDKKWLEEEKQPFPALVCFVHDDRSINVAYFSHAGGHHSASSVQLVQEGDMIKPGNFCTWMPYQIGQAKKHEGSSS